MITHLKLGNIPCKAFSFKREIVLGVLNNIEERLRHLFESKRLIFWSVNSKILEQKLARKEEERKIYGTGYQRARVRLLGLTK